LQRYFAAVTTLFFREKPNVELMGCYKLMAKHAECAGELWAQRWVDYRGVCLQPE
jgi:hypothetical protein